MRHIYMRLNYMRHIYMRLSYMRHTYMRHNYMRHTYMCHNYIGDECTGGSPLDVTRGCTSCGSGNTCYVKGIAIH